ncbi:MAG: FGGY family carbohydrate kinase [Candidatus Bathyarchaeia archaeon]|nr:hypothetical protein [Candidatus Bathyarchaeota archaeon]
MDFKEVEEILPDEEYLLGVNIGTLGSKGLLINPAVVGAEHHIEHDVNVIRPGWVKQDPIACYWEDFREVLRVILKASGVDSKDIECIGASSLTLLLLTIDRDLKPVQPRIIHMDRRAQSECLWVKERIGGGDL